jgi:hypothetical protein
MAAKRGAVERRSVTDGPPQALPRVESGRMHDEAQDEAVPSDYERELDRLDAAARTER